MKAILLTTKLLTASLFSLFFTSSQAFLEEPYKTVACRACLIENDNSHYCYRKGRPFVSCCPAESFTMDCLAITNFDQLCSVVRQEPKEFSLEMLAHCPIFEEDSECGTLDIHLDYNAPPYAVSISNAYPDEKFCNYNIFVKSTENMDQYNVDFIVTSEDVQTALVVGQFGRSLLQVPFSEIGMMKTNLVVSANLLESLSFKLEVKIEFTLKKLYNTLTIAVSVLMSLLFFIFMLLCLQVHKKIDLK